MTTPDNRDRLKKLETARAMAALAPGIPAPIREAVVDLVELQRQFDARLAALEKKING